jgi:uncharacterized membrane protein YdcZ (DUF606 family)
LDSGQLLNGLFIDLFGWLRHASSFQVAQLR